MRARPTPASTQGKNVLSSPSPLRGQSDKTKTATKILFTSLAVLRTPESQLSAGCLEK
jgi:hypothetical protein